MLAFGNGHILRKQIKTQKLINSPPQKKKKNSLTSGRFVYLERERDRMGLETDALVALNE